MGYDTSPNFEWILEAFVSRVAELVVERLADRQEIPFSVGRSHDILSVREAATILRCKPQRIYDLRSAGRLPRTNEGGRAVVRRADLEDLVADESA
jgi:hypothetical protein